MGTRLDGSPRFAVTYNLVLLIECRSTPPPSSQIQRTGGAVFFNDYVSAHFVLVPDEWWWRFAFTVFKLYTEACHHKLTPPYSNITAGWTAVCTAAGCVETSIPSEFSDDDLSPNVSEGLLLLLGLEIHLLTSRQKFQAGRGRCRSTFRCSIANRLIYKCLVSSCSRISAGATEMVHYEKS